MKRFIGLLTALAVLGGLSGCSEQSALSPAGEDADRIVLLSWIMFSGATLILLIVAGALAIAICGPASMRRFLAGESMIRLGGIVVPVLTLSLLLVYGLCLMRERITALEPAVLRIAVTGEQWWWRIGYLRDGAAPVSEANEIRIPVGREIDFVLRASDVIHSFWVPSLGGKLDMIPGRTNTLRLKAARPGIYRGQCAEYCGGPHALMALEIIAMPQADFDAWLAAAERRNEPADAKAARGQKLFLSAGCGSCHAIRGTPATGVVGPDLSRIGERRLLAAATLSNTAENLAGLIRDPQAAKAGMLMPPFAIFSGEDVDALTAYLGSLR